MLVTIWTKHARVVITLLTPEILNATTVPAVSACKCQEYKGVGEMRVNELGQTRTTGKQLKLVCTIYELVLFAKG